MLSIENIRRTARTVPLLARVGLAGLGLAGVADLLAHVEPGAAGGLHGLTGLEAASHVGVLVSMVLVLLGVVVDGARHSRARQTAGNPRKGVA